MNQSIIMDTCLKMKNYKRFEYDNIPIYIDSDYPNWMAVNSAGDRLIQSIQSGMDDILTQSDWQWEINARKFINNFPETPSEPYHGRSEYLSLSHLDECWLHITNQCNLACAYCLFSCDSNDCKALSLEDIRRSVDESYQLGARIFYLTGGEPLVHKDIDRILHLILNNYHDTSLVIMTNGILIPKYEKLLNSLPQDRLFFQVSVDGIGEVNDQTRGKNSFNKLIKGLDILSHFRSRNTIAMTIHAGNIDQMKAVIDLSKSYNMDAVHFMWLIIRGKATPDIYVDPETLFSKFVDACDYAQQQGIEIDNLKNLEAQVFSPAGTRYDLGNAGWRSIAIGADKNIYPTAAMIHESTLNCGSIHQGIENIWRNSEILNRLRRTSHKDNNNFHMSSFKFLTGGSDIDHSYFNGAEFDGHDPYLPFYEKSILWLIAQEARQTETHPYPQILLHMGDKLKNCHSDGEGVSLTHSNCVLTFSSTRKVVGDFYSQADSAQNDDIINPVCYPESEISHIPKHSRIRSYGCGSPVLDANICTNEIVVDLGSGAGVECFIAAKKTKAHGKVFGIDMLDHMIDKANKSMPQVVRNLGYNNIEFRKGFLEAIPLNDNMADLVTSNCVINLSENKRLTFKEIFRILKPGGRIVISDVVTDRMSPREILNDPQLQGECIAGAMVQTYLFSMLESIGFTDLSIMKRFFYRTVKNHHFYSLTYTAFKPEERKTVSVLYPGPYAAVITDHGDILMRGQITQMQMPANSESLSPDILILDSQGNATNIDANNSCCAIDEKVISDCCDPIDSNQSECICDSPKVNIPVISTISIQQSQPKNHTGCMVCGAPLVYLKNNDIKACSYCSEAMPVNAVCENGHFVCDACHGVDALSFAESFLTATQAIDLIGALNTIRSHPSFKLHGPEHHFAIAGVIPAVYKNLGGKISNKEILTAIERGKQLPGGVCGFWGGCGAALGAGIGFGVILDSNPFKPGKRQIVQRIISEITGELSKVKAARCCQRECWISLIKASEISEKYLDIKLLANDSVICTQMDQNKECVKAGCPFYEQ